MIVMANQAFTKTKEEREQIQIGISPSGCYIPVIFKKTNRCINCLINTMFFV
jgi:hypothetical protein